MRPHARRTVKTARPKRPARGVGLTEAGLPWRWQLRMLPAVGYDFVLAHSVDGRTFARDAAGCRWILGLII